MISVLGSLGFPNIMIVSTCFPIPSFQSENCLPRFTDPVRAPTVPREGLRFRVSGGLEFGTRM